jgi:hypothetical protein
VYENTAQGESEAPRSVEDTEHYERTQNLFKIARFLDLSILVYSTGNRFWELDPFPPSGEMVGVNYSVGSKNLQL